ncbi:MAG TPA: endonuclease/exonuclease/phosphatase family protein, partial [Steroidobacteraceae bacterium]|nr:endonuclease/exonuclease/phosphatase family protein [Steroidobacteraceae bacterium]
QARFDSDFVQQEIPPRAPLILAGDFNDWQRRVDGVFRRRLDMTEVSDADEPGWLDRWMPWRKRHPSARTFPSLVPWLRLDRIYVRGISVHDVRVPRGRAWARRSDHVPLIADLELR